LKILQIIIQTREFTSKYLNSLKTFPDPNTLLGFVLEFGRVGEVKALEGWKYRENGKIFHIF